MLRAFFTAFIDLWISTWIVFKQNDHIKSMAMEVKPQFTLNYMLYSNLLTYSERKYEITITMAKIKIEKNKSTSGFSWLISLTK